MLPGFHDLLDIESLTAEQIEFLLDQSVPFQKFNTQPLKKLATLRGKTVALAFFEPSTRTRISFGTAAARLGADTQNLQAEASSLRKGESLLDTVRTLDALKPDCIVMRHSSSGAPHLVAGRLAIPVINAGDGTHEHPTQALLDALTIRDRKGRLDGLRVTIVGDILHSRVARSNIHLLSKFGAQFTLCGPPLWVPAYLESLAEQKGAAVHPHSRASAQASSSPGRIRREPRIEHALDSADVVLVLRVQQERLHEPLLPPDEYVLGYQLTPERLRRARPDAIVLHPGPMVRGMEIHTEVADGPQSCVLEQVTNGLAVRMALLFLMIAGGKPEEAAASASP